MDKEAEEQLNEMRGRCILGGALYALQQTGHTKAAQHPDKVAKALQGMTNLEKEAAESRKPVVEAADIDGLDALSEFAE